MGFLSGALGAVAGATAPVLNYLGQRETNKTNRQIAENNTAFQERMSNTSYQRSVTDLKKAGLNPLLAVKNAGASTPSGSLSTMQNKFSGATADSFSARRLNLDTKLNRELIRTERSKQAQNSATAVKTIIDSDIRKIDKEQRQIQHKGHTDIWGRYISPFIRRTIGDITPFPIKK